MSSELACCYSLINFMYLVTVIVCLCLYTNPNPPKLSVEEFSVPAFSNSSDQTLGNICFDLKLRNMNKAIGLYYDDPFNIAFFYYPYDEPLQKYVWAGTVPAFYQGNGKTKHIRSNMQGNNLQLPSTVVVDPEEGAVETKNVRTLLMDHLLQLPSTFAAGQVRGRTLVVTFRISVVINYRFKYWFGASKHHAEVGADVLVDLNTGERVSTGSIDLSAAPAGGPVMLMLLFVLFVFIMCS